MQDIEIFGGDTFERGKRPPLVESFDIVGLYGYRSVGLRSPYAATVLIAKNGSGKTTLLAALDAFLRAQFTRLASLDFVEMRCKLASTPDELVLRQADLSPFLGKLDESELTSVARRAGVEPSALLRFLVEDYPTIQNDYASLSEDPVYSALLKAYGYRTPDVKLLCDRLIASMFDRIPALKALQEHLARVLHNVDIVYLPTYRRVELPLFNEKEGSAARRRPRIRFGMGGLFSADIQFGLRDISERLSALNQQVMVHSNTGYRELSANIINAAIDGTLDNHDLPTEDLPSKDDLTLFFSRLQTGGRIGPFRESVAIPDMEAIYAADALTNNKFLRYFLAQLNRVIQSTKDTETQVIDFIDTCNKYLFDDDISLSERQLSIDDSDDQKRLRLNRADLSVYAESVASGKRISLDLLSSGEKQMVSLFAKLYLYPNRKIVLVDEPELSLSIDWQRHILVDVVDAPSCDQLIAITHSPFVFDNALEPFAKSLRLAIDRSAQLPDETPADGDDIE